MSLDEGGPLAGVRVVELAGIGPSPMCAMLLADLGATVLRIDRPEPGERGIQRPAEYDLLLRNRAVVRLDLKKAAARDLVLDLVQCADGLIEGFRPGATERLGLGPADCLARNPRLVYGRMTGWGQDGPLAQRAGHDLNYIGLTGALDAIGRDGGPPTPPLNLIGDFGGGALYLAFGMLAAMLRARISGVGQVVDAAIVDGTAHLMTSWLGMAGAGMLTGRRGSNVLDGGAYFYDCYACADGRYVAVAPIERRFHDEMLRRLGLDPADFVRKDDPAFWPEARARLARVFLTRTRDDWAEIFADSDACVTPVLSADEAHTHPHLAARHTLLDVDGIVQPAPAPRFSGTPAGRPKPHASLSAQEVLAAWLPTERLTLHCSMGVFS